MSDALMSVNDLHVEFDTYGGVVKAVRGVSFDAHPGQTLAIVGESGCAKSVTVQSLMGLIPMPPGRITQGTATLNGQDILGSKVIDGNDIRGDQVSMIFQDPMTSLNPTMNIGNQIAETLQVHRGYSHRDAFKRAVELLELTKIPEAAKRAKQYPFEFSGGMLQRAMIAMAIACEPTILIADEPTTALDVTIQAQILDLLNDLQQETQMSIILITHDPDVAKVARRQIRIADGELVEDTGAEMPSAQIPETDQNGRRHSRLGDWQEALKSAVRSLHSNLFRTALTLLGRKLDMMDQELLLQLSTQELTVPMQVLTTKTTIQKQ